MEINNPLNHREWANIYRKLVHWELELQESKDEGIMQVLKMQKEEANLVFTRFIENNYLDWVNRRVDDVPILSHTLFKSGYFHTLMIPEKLFLLVIDNLRYDQWESDSTDY